MYREKKNTHEALLDPSVDCEERCSFLRELFIRLPAAVLILNSQGTIYLANNYAKDLLKSDLEGNTFDKLVYDQHEEEYFDWLKQIFKSKNGIKPLEMVSLEDGDGKKISVNIKVKKLLQYNLCLFIICKAKPKNLYDWVLRLFNVKRFKL